MDGGVIIYKVLKYVYRVFKLIILYVFYNK